MSLHPSDRDRSEDERGPEPPEKKAAPTGETAGRGGLQEGVNHCTQSLPGTSPASNAELHPDLTRVCMSMARCAESRFPEGSTGLDDFIRRTRGDVWKNAVNRIREHMAAGDKQFAEAEKKKLPAILISGIIKGPRKSAAEEGRLDHSGLLQCDFDGKENPGKTPEQIRKILESDKFVVALFISPSGNGVKAIVRISKDCSKHRSVFRAVKRHFEKKGIVMDQSTSDPGRLCFVSYDPEAWIRNAEVFELPPEDDRADDGEFRDSFTVEGIVELLAVIPPNPPYKQWLEIASAVFNEVGEAAGTEILKRWSPEENEGEYAAKFKARLSQFSGSYLVRLARKHGLAGPLTENEIPPDVIPVPGGEVGNEVAARIIFKKLGEIGRLYVQNNTVVEIQLQGAGGAEVSPVCAARLSALVEVPGMRVARRETTKNQKGVTEVRWRTCTMPPTVANVLLSTTAAKDLLPPLRQVVSNPLIIEKSPGVSAILGAGYHSELGGVYVAGELTEIQDLPLPVAVSLLMHLLRDFDFCTPSDLSRAMAMLLSPALKMGGIISDDFPIDVSEADRSQSGKTFRLKQVSALYGESPSVIVAAKGGVGSVDESISQALINGRPFIVLENVRGKIDSTILESVIRGQSQVQARAMRVSKTVDTTPFMIQISTNGAELTQDLANRSIITRIRKREGIDFPEGIDGGPLKHIAARRSVYLKCVHTIVSEWIVRGKPKTNERRHDFREWCQSVDWIVQDLCGLPPLLDGHSDLQARVSSPVLIWLREVCTAAKKQGRLGGRLTAADIAEFCDSQDIPLPGRSDSKEPPKIRVGKVLKGLFSNDQPELRIDSFIVSRSEIERVGPNRSRQFASVISITECP